MKRQKTRNLFESGRSGSKNDDWSMIKSTKTFQNLQISSMKLSKSDQFIQIWSNFEFYKIILRFFESNRPCKPSEMLPRNCWRKRKDSNGTEQIENCFFGVIIPFIVCYDHILVTHDSQFGNVFPNFFKLFRKIPNKFKIQIPFSLAWGWQGCRQKIGDSKQNIKQKMLE